MLHCKKIKNLIDNDKNECSICLNEISLKYLNTTSCGHTFHKKCINKWIIQRNNCPNCRFVFKDMNNYYLFKLIDNITISTILIFLFENSY